MKRFTYLGIICSSMILTLAAAFAQAPQVPVTYPGDTEETIARRAQWIEGAKKEGRVIWWSTTQTNEAKPVVAAFSKRYPFIKLEHVRMGGVDQETKMLAEFKTGRVPNDIAQANIVGRELGMIERFIDILPGIKNWDPRRYTKAGDAVRAGSNVLMPFYNTNLVSAAEAPTRWSDLLDPKWKGQMRFAPEVKTWVTLALGEGGWGVEKTIDYVTKLKAQNPAMFKAWNESVTVGAQELMAGKIKIYTNGYLQHILVAKRQGAPVDWCRLVDPIPISGSFFTLRRNSPNPNAARLFLEWFFSTEGLLVFEEATFYGEALPGAGTVLSKMMEGRKLIVRTEEVIQKAEEMGLERTFEKIMMGK